jgi:hypothetical protein
VDFRYSGFRRVRSNVAVTPVNCDIDITLGFLLTIHQHKGIHMQGVLLFIDNSNIYISGKDLADQKDGPGSRSKFRMEFAHLVQLALAGRKLLGAYVVGSIPPEDKAVWDSLEKSTGIKPELFERGGISGGEQGLDQCLQVHMLRAINDYKDPQIVVLMTGDGAGYEDGVGFHADLERMHESGWGVEVLSWEHSCNQNLKKWACNKGVFISLDSHYDSISFVKGVRTSTAVALQNRPLSRVRMSPLQLAAEKARLAAEARVAEMQEEINELKKKRKGKEKYERRFKNNRA